MKTIITGIISRVKLVEVPENNLKFIYGTVDIDYLGRFKLGCWVLSSAIKRIDTDNLLVYTQNSVYKIDALPSPIMLTPKQFFLVNQGDSATLFTVNP